MLPLEDHDEQQIRDDVMDVNRDNGNGSVDNLITKMDNAHHDIVNALDQIKDINGNITEGLNTKRSNRTTYGQQSTKSYNDENQMDALCDHDNS